MSDELIVALDFEDTDHARHLINQLGESVNFYKIGLELAYNGGIELARELKDSGKRVFIDLKLHDIGTTVERTTMQISKFGLDFLTIHRCPQTMEAAKQGAGNNLKLLAVTVMTSYNDLDLALAGYKSGIWLTVTKRAMQASSYGVDGVVLSPLELLTIRQVVGKDMLLVTPGIRPVSTNSDDQKRVMTPAEAINHSANHIVVGRPITRAIDPRKVAEQIQKEIAEVRI